VRRFAFGILGLLGLAFTAAPASAVNVPECGGDFIIFAKKDIVFEAGLTLLTGDIFNQSPTGVIKVGANNVLHGTVSANKIIVSNGAVVDECIANVLELQGTGTCTTSTVPGFNPSAACLAAAPIPLPAFPAVCTPGTVVNIPNNTPGATLAPGCYSNVRVGKSSTLTLTPGGAYFFKGAELRLLAGATLISGTGQPAAAATVTVQGNLITENGITVNNLLVNALSTSGQAVQIFNNSLLQDAVINAPNGNAHPHTGTQLRGSTELIAGTFRDIEPITNEQPPRNDICVCPPGFHFPVPGPTPDRICVPN
jgi:hypothetical protein